MMVEVTRTLREMIVERFCVQTSFNRDAIHAGNRSSRWLILVGGHLVRGKHSPRLLPEHSGEPHMSVSEPKVVLDQFGRSAFHRDALNWLIDVLPREVREANESVLQKSITHHRESLKSARRITKRWRRSILIVLAVRFLVGAAIFLVVMRGLYDLLPSWLFDLAGIFAVIGMLLYASRRSRLGQIA